MTDRRALDVAVLPPAVVAACRGAADKLASDVIVLAVGEVLSIADHFVIASAPNDRQVKAIAESVEQAVVDAGEGKPIRVEGLDALRWVLLDYGDLVVHVFLEEERAFYELERLWADVPILRWEDVEGAGRARGSGAAAG